MVISGKHQQGMTFISLIVLLGFIGSMAILVLKILPIYLDHNKVSNAVKQIKASDGLLNMSEADIRQSFAKKFNVNYVTDVKPQDVQIIRSGGYLKVSIEYEVVKPIVGNLSVLVDFNDSFEVGG